MGMNFFSKNKKVEINQKTEEKNMNKEEVQFVEKAEEKANTYTFITPLIVGVENNGEFKYLNEVSFREPTGGDLRGLTLMKVYESDMDSWLVLLPRITTPSINSKFLEKMNLMDITNLIAKVLDFLPSKEKSTNSQAK